MGQLVFQATLGGQVNLVGPNTASTFNINVPAVAGTMVTTGDTGTVTNTMLASSAYASPGTIGSTTPNTGAFTTLSASSTTTLSGGTANGVAYLNGSKVVTTGSAVTYDGTTFTTTGAANFATSTGNVGIGTSSPKEKLDSRGAAVFSGDNSTGTNAFGTASGILLSTASDNSAARITAVSNGNNNVNLVLRSLNAGSATSTMTLDYAGNLGLGVTPSAWGANYKAFDIKRGDVFQNSTLNWLGIANNAYNDGTNWIYKETGVARMFRIQNDQFEWHNAPSGSNPNTVSFTQAMTLDASGQLQLGTTSNFLSLNREMSMNAASGTVGVSMGVGGTLQSLFYSNTSATYVGTNSSTPLILQTGGSERARILSSGELCVGINSTIGVGAKCNIQSSGNVLHLQSTNNSSNNIVSYNSSGTATFSVSATGAVSKASGSFRIDHPLPELEATHQLVHSFVEAPQADNIYRGKVSLVNGTAIVNIDLNSGMTEGTFVLLNREVQCFTTNETGWTAVRGNVQGNLLTIEAQDKTCTDTISWLVIGERQDKHMYETDWTDKNGKVIVEPLKGAKA